MAPPLKTLELQTLTRIAMLEQERISNMPIEPFIAQFMGIDPARRESERTAVSTAQRGRAAELNFDYIRRAQNMILGAGEAQDAEREPHINFRQGDHHNFVIPPAMTVLSSEIPDSDTELHNISISADYIYSNDRYVCSISSGSLCIEAEHAISAVASSFVQSMLRNDIARRGRDGGMSINQIFIGNITNGISIAKANDVDYNQMARDNVWPMFWYTLIGRNRITYNRDTAKQDIARFRDRYNITKKHWKFLCNKPHLYLYHLYNLEPRLRNIKWDNNLLCAADHTFREIMHRPLISQTFMYDWLRQLFDRVTHGNDSQRTSRAEFINIMRDFCDILHRQLNIERLRLDIENIDNWDTFQAYVRMIEAGYHDRIGDMTMHYGQQMIRAGAFHYIDEVAEIPREYMINAMMHGKPDNHTPTKEPYEALKDYPKEVEAGGYKAVLLDNDISLKKEGDTLRHCIYSTYRSRISKGRYIAYHVTGDGCGKSGATCGLRKTPTIPRRRLIRAPTADEVMNPKMEWSHDQTRGKCNSTPDRSSGLGNFINHLVDEVNKSIDTDCQEG